MLANTVYETLLVKGQCYVFLTDRNHLASNTIITLAKKVSADAQENVLLHSKFVVLPNNISILSFQTTTVSKAHIQRNYN